MKTAALIGTAFGMVLLLAGLSPAAEYYDPSSASGKSSDATIAFCGRVVDQSGNPVYKAQVTAGREYLDMNRIRFFGVEVIRTETDAAGQFTVTGLALKKVHIKAIEKRGFEPLPQPKAFSLEEGGEQPPYRPDPAKPVVFVLQKKFDAGLVDNKKGRLVIRPDAEGFTVDLFTGFSHAMEKIPSAKASQDIVVRFAPSKDQQRVMTIAAPGAKNGVADKEGTPHTAPDAGYAPSLLYKIPQRGPSKVTVYHKGRGGKVYSRLELDIEPVENKLRISAGLFVNIEGRQNTDFDSFHTEEELVRMTGKKLSYGGSAYRDAVEAILQNTIQ